MGDAKAFYLLDIPDSDLRSITGHVVAGSTKTPGANMIGAGVSLQPTVKNAEMKKRQARHTTHQNKKQPQNSASDNL